MGVLANVLIGVAVAYVGLALVVYFFQARLLYFPNLPSRQVEGSPADEALAFESLQIKTEDGETLDGWYVPAGNPRATLLYLHGNGGNIGHRGGLIKVFHELDLNVLIIDYRGYGRSTGKPGEAGTYRDAAAAWRYLTETRRIPASGIVLFGESLGGAVAAWLAQRHTPRALLLYAAFTSVPDLAGKLYTFLPVRLLARYQYDTKIALAAVDCPVLIMHSREDEIVPYSQGQELLTAAPEPKRLVALRGGHNDALLISQRTFVQAVDEFLQATCMCPRIAGPFGA